MGICGRFKRFGYIYIYIYIERERDEMNPIMINSTWANNITPMLDI